MTATSALQLTGIAIGFIVLVLATLPTHVRLGRLPNPARRMIQFLYLMFAAAGLLVTAVFRSNSQVVTLGSIFAGVGLTLSIEVALGRLILRRSEAKGGTPQPDPRLEPVGPWTDEDPGWRRALIASIPIYSMIARYRKTDDGLIRLRSVFVGLVSSNLLFVVALAFIDPWRRHDSPLWPAWLVLGISATVLTLVVRVRRRMIGPADAFAAAVRYRTQMFVGIALSEWIALIGVTLVFIERSLWIYVLSLPFAVAGMLMIAPSRSSLDRIDERLKAMGSSRSIRQALRAIPSPPFPPPPADTLE